MSDSAPPWEGCEEALKIALVSDWYLPRLGGLELQLLGLARGLAGRGHEVHVVTPCPGPEGRPAPWGEASSPDSHQPFRVHRLDVPRVPRLGFMATARGFRAMGDALERLGPDRVHAHVSVVSPAGWGGATAARALGIPAVVTFHSLLDPFRVPLRILDGLLGWRSWDVSFTAVSTRVARGLEGLLARERIRVIPNGIDPERWRPDPEDGCPPPGSREAGTPAGLRAVSVMRLRAKKRPHALPLILRRARRRAGAAEVRLTLVGDGPERGRTRALSRLLGVKGSLELTGRLSREGVRRRLMEAHVFVFPTVRESFGLAALEARAMGLPVLARAGSGVADVVEDGREGFLVASDRALADVLARLARDPGALAEARRRSRESPLPRSLTWAGVLDAYEDVYGRDARR